MSEVVYLCECGKTYRINSSFSGRVSRCVRCRREYIVPSAAQSESRQISEDPEEKETIVDASEELDFQFPQPPPLPQAVILETDGETDGEADDVALSSLESLPSEPLSEPSKTPKIIVLGKYEIREKIGEGGMGNVFVAWDTELQREVTIKTLNVRGKKLDRFKERFLNEARITGRLEHSGVVPIHLLDYDAKGVPYYVMRLLEGRTMTQLIEQYHHSKISSFSPETLRELLRHFIDACQTIAYAHDHFIVHRDIKPANIMLGGYGETIVLDWGLSKLLTDKTGDKAAIDDDSAEDSAEDSSGEENSVVEAVSESDDPAPDLTMVGGRLGTAGYQSPEYLQSGVSSPSDDIYALGVTLYHLLCDRAPHKLAKNQRGVFEMLADPPMPPHLINPHVDRPLAAVCLCAMAFDKEKRYPRAERLAADLQRWLDGEAVSVYRMSWTEKAMLLWRKNGAWIGLALAGFVFGLFVAQLLWG